MMHRSFWLCVHGWCPCIIKQHTETIEEFIKARASRRQEFSSLELILMPMEIDAFSIFPLNKKLLSLLTQLLLLCT